MRDLHITEPWVEIDLGARGKRAFPAWSAALEDRALVIGDNQGMKVASFPYADATEVREGVWSFDGRRGKFTVRGIPAPSQEAE